MATVRLDNLIRPKQVNTQRVSTKEEVFAGDPVYTDLYLDLKMAVSVGTGLAPGVSNDIMVSFDDEAIKNSIHNIIYTKPGQKLLTPTFGTNLDIFLFNPLSEVRADAIGHYLINQITKFEPRVSIEQVIVNVNYDDNAYEVTLFYTMPNLNKSKSLIFKLKSKFGG